MTAIKSALPATGFALAAALLLAGCGAGQPSVAEQNRRAYEEAGGVIMDEDDARRAERGSLFGPGGLRFGGRDRDEAQDGTGVGVNAFLWGASLDTLSFLPITSADPFGGVIITDWYTPPDAPSERIKVNAFILGRELRSDGVRVSVFKQVFNEATQAWVDAPVDATVGRGLEDAILTSARQRRVAGQT